MTQSGTLFPDQALTELDRELWLAKRMAQHLTATFTGATDREIRKERFRTGIIAGGLTAVIVGGTNAGKPETYARVFERIYGEPLEPNAKRGAA